MKANATNKQLVVPRLERRNVRIDWVGEGDILLKNARLIINRYLVWRRRRLVGFSPPHGSLTKIISNNWGHQAV